MDPHTGMQAQDTAAMLHAAQSCLKRHSRHKDRACLRRGLEALDLACLMQSVGDRPWMGAASGLLARGNTSPTADPEVSAEFALCAMRYGKLTGTKEYSERGVAALRAALAADCDDSTAARIAAVAAIARAEFGSLRGLFADGGRMELSRAAGG